MQHAQRADREHDDVEADHDLVEGQEGREGPGVAVEVQQREQVLRVVGAHAVRPVVTRPRRDLRRLENASLHALYRGEGEAPHEQVEEAVEALESDHLVPDHLAERPRAQHEHRPGGADDEVHRVRQDDDQEEGVGTEEHLALVRLRVERLRRDVGGDASGGATCLTIRIIQTRIIIVVIIVMGKGKGNSNNSKHSNSDFGGATRLTLLV